MRMTKAKGAKVETGEIGEKPGIAFMIPVARK
jgi:hypothetical protein